MLLDKTIWVVCDANGECKGLFSDKELALKIAHFYGAYLTSWTKVICDVSELELPAEEVSRG